MIHFSIALSATANNVFFSDRKLEGVADSGGLYRERDIHGVNLYNCRYLAKILANFDN